MIVVSVLDESIVDGGFNEPFRRRNKSIKFGIIGKFDGSLNGPGIGGGGGNGGGFPITSKLTDDEFVL